MSKFIADNDISINNLKPLAFVTSEYKVMNIDDAIDLKSRPEDISFFFFCCTMDGLFVNKRVTNENTLSFQVFLTLPRHIYDIKEDKVEPFITAAGTPSTKNTAKSLGGYFSTIKLFMSSHGSSKNNKKG